MLHNQQPYPGRFVPQA